MSNVFKKLSKFEATIEVAGQEVEASYFDGGLSLKVDADLALAVLTQLAKLRGPQAAKTPKAAKQPRAPKVQPQAAASPAVPLPAAPIAAPRTVKAPPLETPDELRAKREARKQEAKPEPAPAPQGDPDGTKAEEHADPGAKPAPFVEDLQIHQALDGAKAIVAGAEVPKELLNANKLREAVAWLMDKYDLSVLAEVQEACLAWRPHVPKLRDIPDGTFKLRVANQFEIEMADRSTAKDRPGVA